MPRVEIKIGGEPILLVAPHGGGPTDLLTAEITDNMAYWLDAYAVINTGWVRPWKGQHEGSNQLIKGPHKVNVKKGIANLNNTDHCKREPLLTEFLRPIYNLTGRILQKSKKANIFLIHGMDDTKRDYGGVDVVVGYGQGDPPRNSCTFSFKDRFLGALALEKFTPAQGKKGGRLSAWNDKNLNQLFIKENGVESIQVEIALSLRNTNKIALETAHRLSKVIEKTCDRSIVIPTLKTVREY